MKIQSLTITFLLATLTACAVDKNDSDGIAGSPDSPTATDQSTRQWVDQISSQNPSVIAVPKPREIKVEAQQSQSEMATRLFDEVVAYDFDPAAAASPAANDRMTVMKRSQVLPGSVGAALVQNNIRYAVEPLYRENYQHLQDQGVKRVASHPVSTFSIDVDTAAYANMRRWLNQGQLPPEDAVRVEELINYFDYDYPHPDNRAEPFMVNTEIAPTPWNPETHLLRIGIQGYNLPKAQLPASNLVFLIDVSGSMNSADKLPLLQQALSMLVGQLDAQDSISIVVYAGASGVVLPPTRGDHKADILFALQQLQAGGSTNGAAGIRLAYQLAQQNFIEKGVNRVILATDGDFNVGLASTEELIDLIQRQRAAGIALTTLGFGSGNYNDHLLEQLADEGDGNYAYIDRLQEAQKVLAEELSATLMTIARDVKIQIEFNPARVSEYRLIGYENRLLNEEDFSNDKVDAGEIGAGHRVTALYEISLTGSSGQRLPPRRYQSESTDAEPGERALDNELAHLRIRYKLPDESVSKLIEAPVLESGINDLASESFNFAAAVAAFGQKLRGGIFLENFSYLDIGNLAQRARGNDPHGYRAEFMQLVSLAGTLDKSANFSHNTTED